MALGFVTCLKDDKPILNDIKGYSSPTGYCWSFQVKHVTYIIERTVVSAQIDKLFI